MKRLSYPIDVQIELTERCNFKCRHCYNYWRYEKDGVKQELGIVQFLTILKILKDGGVSVITLTGGEPFLRSNVLFALLKNAKSYGMEVGLNSNAALIVADYANQLKKFGLDHALCSVLGIEQTHNLIVGTKDGFSHTMKGVKNLVKAGINVAINMVVSKLNQNELYETGKMLSGYGIRTFCATPMVPSHESNKPYALSGEECKKALKTLLRLRKDFGFNIDTLEPIARCLFNENEEDDFIQFFGNRICSAAVTSCAISSVGRMRPCIHADKDFGSLLQDDLLSIWGKMSPWSDEEILPNECKECTATAICEGGCRMSAKIIHGCYNGKDMYMKGPILDRERSRKIISTEKQDDIEERESFKINSVANFRKEGFGGIVYVGNAIEFFTEEGFLLVQNLRHKGEFSVDEVAPEAKTNTEEAMQILLNLFRKKIILRTERR